MSITNLAIRSRLAIAFAVVTSLLLSILAIGLSGQAGLHRAMDDLVDNRYAEIAMSNRIKSIAEQGANLLGRMLLSPDAGKRKVYMDEYAVIRSANSENLKKFEAMLDDDQGRRIFVEQTKARQAYGAVVRKVMDLLAADKQEEALAVYQNDMRKPQADYYSLIDKMVDYEARSMVSSVANAKAASQQARLQMIGASVLAVLLAVATAWTITRSISRPIHRAIEMAEAVAAGRLVCSNEVHSRDEVGRLMSALDRMVASLHRIVSDVRAGADTISAAAHEVSRGNLDLSARTEQTASALEQTASSMAQITSAVKLGAESADKANESAARASTVANRSGEAVSQVVDTMSSIATSSRRVVEIIGVIDGIAFQTNILALNAAVEAARAGENGRSFAVVANEVRNLAQRSAEAAKEIKTLIAASVEQVEVGSKLVQSAGTTMHEVVTSIQQVSQIVAEISASSREQSLGIDQINTAILQMDDSTRRNAAVAEEGTAASDALQSQARQLTDVVRAFAL